MKIFTPEPIEISIKSDGDLFHINLKANNNSFHITITDDIAKTMSRALIDENPSVETIIKANHLVQQRD